MKLSSGLVVLGLVVVVTTVHAAEFPTETSTGVATNESSASAVTTSSVVEESSITVTTTSDPGYDQRLLELKSAIEVAKTTGETIDSTPEDVLRTVKETLGDFPIKWSEAFVIATANPDSQRRILATKNLIKITRLYAIRSNVGGNKKNFKYTALEVASDLGHRDVIDLIDGR